MERLLSEQEQQAFEIGRREGRRELTKGEKLAYAAGHREGRETIRRAKRGELVDERCG